MPETPIYQDNHYVPQCYLKQWASDNGRVWTYRILVSHHNVPKWKVFSTKGIAYHAHLYTRIAADAESDEIEKWFGQEFEAPTGPILNKAISGGRLTRDDWMQLIKFLAAQDIRTPASLLEFLNRWKAMGEKLMQETLEESVRRLETTREKKVRSTPFPHSEFFPLKVSTIRDAQSDQVILQAQTVVGRGLWLFNIKRALSTTVNALMKHKWTILKAPKDITWCTSDDPVIKLNYYQGGHYDFKGGWGSNGTEIMLPISPHHVMYTKIGERPPRRGTIVSEDHAKIIQQCIVEHADRFIFAIEPDPKIEQMRPRMVSKELYETEREQWKLWHKENVSAEHNLNK